MKNEVLARAITGIDDDLIVSAHRPAFFRQRMIKCFGAFATACLIFVCGTFFLSPNNSELEILINGTAVSSQPVSVMPHERQIAPTANIITVPLEIVSNGDLTIMAVDGTIEVYSSQTNERISVGQFCKTKDSVTVRWIIDDPDHSQTCKMRVNDQELILRYEQTTNEWIITKSED